MARKIFIVNAIILDANAAFSMLDGYPKTFDSKHYGLDEEKTQWRAESDMYEVWSAMCKRDDRLLQSVYISDVFGDVIEKKSKGGYPV